MCVVPSRCVCVLITIHTDWIPDAVLVMWASESFIFEKNEVAPAGLFFARSSFFICALTWE